MRDDIDKLPLTRAAKRYARMKSADLGQNWSKKTDMFMDMVASTTGQEKEGFRNRDAAGKVPHAMKGMAEAVVESLLGDEEEGIRAVDEEEGIRAAAVKTSHGHIFTGVTHWEAVAKAAQRGETSYADEDLGFVTTTGRFVDRQEAEMIGARQGQLQKTIEDPQMVHAREFTHYL